MKHVLNLNVHVKENEDGTKEYLGIEAIVPDEFSMAEFIGYIQMASMDLANQNSNIKELKAG